MVGVSVKMNQSIPMSDMEKQLAIERAILAKLEQARTNGSRDDIRVYPNWMDVQKNRVTSLEMIVAEANASKPVAHRLHQTKYPCYSCNKSFVSQPGLTCDVCLRRRSADLKTAIRGAGSGRYG